MDWQLPSEASQMDWQLPSQAAEINWQLPSQVSVNGLAICQAKLPEWTGNCQAELPNALVAIAKPTWLPNGLAIAKPSCPNRLTIAKPRFLNGLAICLAKPPENFRATGVSLSSFPRSPCIIPPKRPWLADTFSPTTAEPNMHHANGALVTRKPLL